MDSELTPDSRVRPAWTRECQFICYCKIKKKEIWCWLLRFIRFKRNGDNEIVSPLLFLPKKLMKSSSFQILPMHNQPQHISQPYPLSTKPDSEFTNTKQLLFKELAICYCRNMPAKFVDTIPFLSCQLLFTCLATKWWQQREMARSCGETRMSIAKFNNILTMHRTGSI